MSRTAARKCAVQFLYRVDFVEYSGIDEVTADIDDFWQNHCPALSSGAIDFAYSLIKGTIAHLNNIDDVISQVTKHWRIERIAQMDKAILRCAVYELLYCPDIPSSVSINEALEIAKQFSTAESVAFLNGVLDKIAKKHGYKK